MFLLVSRLLRGSLISLFSVVSGFAVPRFLVFPLSSCAGSCGFAGRAREASATGEHGGARPPSWLLGNCLLCCSGRNPEIKSPTHEIIRKDKYELSWFFPLQEDDIKVEIPQLLDIFHKSKH